MPSLSVIKVSSPLERGFRCLLNSMYSLITNDFEEADHEFKCFAALDFDDHILKVVYQQLTLNKILAL